MEALRDKKKRVPLQMQDLDDRLNLAFFIYNIMYVRTLNRATGFPAHISQQLIKQGKNNSLSKASST